MPMSRARRAGGLSVSRRLAVLPKAELHLHLAGALQEHAVSELAAKYGRRQGIVREYQRGVAGSGGSDAGRPASREGRGLERFLSAYREVATLIREKDDLLLAAASVAERLRADSVIYAEVMFDFGTLLENGITPPDLRDGLEDIAGRDEGIDIRWIADLGRDDGPDAAYESAVRLVEMDCRSVVGVTLGGREGAFDVRRFLPAFEVARSHGLRVTVHAGETGGAGSVGQAIDVLNPDRIGHGVQAVDDPRVVEELVERGIPLEISIASNIATGVCERLAAHPVLSLLRRGVRVTLNTDDPGFFGSSLTDEYRSLVELGAADDEVYAVLAAGFESAFVGDARRREYLERLDRAWRDRFADA